MLGKMSSGLSSFVSPLVPAEESDEGSSSEQWNASAEGSSGTAGSWLERARSAAGLEPSPREECIDMLCPKMTFKQRLYAFGTCFVAGLLLSLSSMFAWTDLMLGHPTKFAVRLSVGNVLSLLGTGFVVGPRRQLKYMTSPTRWGAALVFVLAMAATLVSALVVKQELLVLACIIVQFLAMLWYMLSFIPFARRAVSSCLKSAVSDEA